MFVCGVNEVFFLHHIRHRQHVECAKWVMPRCCYQSLKRYLRASSAHKEIRRLNIGRSDLIYVVLQHVLWKETKKQKRNYLKDSSRTFFFTADFTLLLRLRSGAIWGLFYWLSDITSQLLQETHSHQDLVGQEFTPICKKKNFDKSHHTRYGHTNEKTTIQIFMKSFPNGNI